MKKREIEARVRHGFSMIAPDALPENVRNACVAPSDTSVTPMRRVPVWRAAVAVAAVMTVIVLSVVLWQGISTPTAAWASVSLDVNPSIGIEVDGNETVLAVTALNADGVQLLGMTDFKGMTLKETVDTLIPAMVQSGYLSDVANSVLISVNSADAALADTLQKKLADEVQVLLSGGKFEGAVLSQTVLTDDELERQAKAHGISEGKAMLIRRIVENDPLKNFDELAALSINDLNLLLAGTQTTAVSGSGTASEKSYIGADAALQEALAHAGIAVADIAYADTELDYEDGVMCYEIEFVYGGIEYEYEIHAVSGEVLKSRKETAEDDRDDEAEREILSQSAEYMAATEVKAATLAHAGVDQAAVTEYEIELDVEDGRAVYELEFSCNGIEYEYTVDALTGEILKNDQETED